MNSLKTALEMCGLQNVHTYIQSGNVFFDSHSSDASALAMLIEQCVFDTFTVTTKAVVFTYEQWKMFIGMAPSWWGRDKTWKHNLLVLLPPYDMDETVSAIGSLKPDIERLELGDGVLYQSMSFALFGHTTTSKLTSRPIYKQLTIRNYNTATKLLEKF
jgi:uncharacterized protein (DUF1697 family)